MPSIANYNSIINAFSKKGMISIASNLLKEALDKGFVPYVITYKTLLKDSKFLGRKYNYRIITKFLFSLTLTNEYGEH